MSLSRGKPPWAGRYSKRGALLAALVVMAAGLATAEERVSPARVRHVSLSVEIAYPLPAMTSEDLTTHLVVALRTADPAITIQDRAVDRIRVTVSVHPMSATTLRGFWLPFSGTYGIGTLRLGVERMVTVPGIPRPVPAIMWQAERPVAGPWRTTDRQIAWLLDEMVADLAEARREAHAAEARCAGPPRMIVVPAGEFWIGSDAAERRVANALSSQATRDARWFDAELPRHRVTLPVYCIDRTLVTQAQYAEFVSAAGHRVPAISRDDYERQGFLVHDYEREVTRYRWRDRRPPAELANHPVVLVSATDAEAYCRWRAPDLRLPTEPEWEKAARGARGSIFPWGDAWKPDHANSAASGANATTPVTRYPAGASPYGVLDAVGNVFQWTASSLADGRRVLKGCGWDDDAGLCRPAFRHGRAPASRHILIGFRCAGPAE